MESVINKHQRQALDTFGFRAALPLFCGIGEDADHLAFPRHEPVRVSSSALRAAACERSTQVDGA
jgi:hypothetical protein